MINKAEFYQLPHGKIFASGFAPDGPEGLHMIGSGNTLRWVAVKGYGQDWAMYCFWAVEEDLNYIAEHGKKVHDLDNVKQAIEVDADVLGCYRRK